jgi:8-oxo-dGTP pyrophosphatase MutT (NUDIX family)
MPLSIRARRLAYRLAYRGLQLSWFLRRPHKRGVKCLITFQGRILLVRHTYGPRAWDLPGGGMRRGEPPLEAARREMQEELGLGDAPWRASGELRGTDSFRHDVIHCFRADLSSPLLDRDPVELATADWFALDALPPDLGRYVPVFLTRVLPATGGL